MTISYNWLSEYLPQTIAPEELSKILTSIGLEVESMEKYESIKGGLKGLVIGEVLTCEQHPNADKLKKTTVNIGGNEPLQIVCGASNVATGQKVVVAPVGTTIYPTSGEPITMKVAKIRGVESYGMICAEDEIGIGESHSGIMILRNDAQPGTPAFEYFNTYNDVIYEIGLTPNRMDAMSHIGVAKDVCAYLSYHKGQEIKPVLPYNNELIPDNLDLPISVTIENEEACQRYAGVSISNVQVKPSPEWLQNRLKAIGIRAINNIVDITNFILHETGQPLHAFDADAITGNQVIIKNLPQGTPFITLDGKERKLNAADLMICNAQTGMCIAGVFGGAESGVKESTTNIFLESAWFNPVSIRKTSFTHGLRTDAATRFEKGVDISNTVNVLKRAALLIKELAGGSISSDVVDVYPHPQPKTIVTLTYSFLKKLSGKQYSPTEVKTILTALGFEVVLENEIELTLAVPFSKPDISLPADIVEEIVRIDGLDNIAIPTAITISPAIETIGFKEALKDKLAQYLTGLGFIEIMTNSITNSSYFNEATLAHTVKMINNLSADLNVMRPSMLETGLEAIGYNLNRKNNNLRFFEFGKTYFTSELGHYKEEEHLCLYATGQTGEDEWNGKGKAFDFFDVKGFVAAVLTTAGIKHISFDKKESENSISLNVFSGKNNVGTVSYLLPKQLKQFDIKQPVCFADISFDKLIQAVQAKKIAYEEVSRFPSVQRDLSIIVNKRVTYADVQNVVNKLKLQKLTNMRLFDVFESDKLGIGKKSFAISFTFMDEEKTLTDKEIEAAVNKIIQVLEKDLEAEIRKQ
ncbi:phenylalanine--tRNA ligase subunit beta [Ilyomonas limi]|uniref:Phenylalanine--tRNA ligase beta subunit n=1 Tax=Ilyomonas limi TaxID=2575867 RepID=A0A4U3L3T6_9BACT|nr:phenylalanine--tRNA ligase subunit beta [Ilyomonas limi]TKK68969.1 phenylalanine--tRNA ligase subunit beta [Ilyomonas limi]